MSESSHSMPLPPQLEQRIRWHKGIVDLSTLGDRYADDVRSVLEYTSSYIKKGLERWIHRGPLNWTPQSRQTRFELLADQKPDCFVYPTDDGYFIGMTVGFPLRLLAMSSTLMVNKDVFSTIHDVTTPNKRDTAALNPSAPVDTADDDVYMTKDGTMIQLEEIGRARWNYAFAMAMDSLRFLVCHECAHIFRGHLYHRGCVSGLSFFDESEGPLPDQSLSFNVAVGEEEFSNEAIERFYELDADAWASHILIREQGDRSYTDPNTKHVTQRRLNRALMAIAMLFIIQRPVGTLTSYDRSRYPHPRTRFQCVITWSLTTLAKELRLEDDQDGKRGVVLYLKDALEAIDTLYRILPSEYKEEFETKPEAFSHDLDKNLMLYDRLTSLLFGEANTLLPSQRR